MTQPPLLTDPDALARNRSRMRSDSLFLQKEAADDVLDRLSLVNRAFSETAVITPAPEVWLDVPAIQSIHAPRDTLEFAAKSQDAIIHALGLHWANDPVGQMIQCRHALKPDGLFIGTLFGGQTLHELRSVLSEAEVAQSGGLSPRVAPMGEIRDLGALLQRAGFALPVADSYTLTVTYADMFHLMREIRAMGEGNALAARLRHPTKRAVFLDAAERYQDAYPADAGRITATFEIVVLTGWAPSENQPKPLRPGSAQQRLADALKTDEKPLSD